jgi:hypothetical protein
MKKLLLATILVPLSFAVTPAKANVVFNPSPSGTGDNVIFDSVAGNIAFGSFNGKHPGFVEFKDLSGNPAFTGAANGQDIKISNTNDLFIQVLDPTKTMVLPTLEQVFSLKGTGDVTAFVQATDGLFKFDLGVIDPHSQSWATFTAVDNETMTSLTLVDATGEISDYEHYRIDVAPTSPVPLPGALGLFVGGLTGLGFLSRFRRRLAA